VNEKEYQSLFDEFEGTQDDIIAIFLRIQEKDGYISPDAVKRVSKFLGISENQLYGTVSFYPKFGFVKPGRNTVKVCMGTACHVHGGLSLCDAVGWQLGISLGQTTDDGRFDFRRVTCLGCCTLAPVVQIQGCSFQEGRTHASAQSLS